MNTNGFLVAAKRLVWRKGFSVDFAFMAELEELLLARLGESGEITDEDRAWARALVRSTFDDGSPVSDQPQDA